MKDGGSPSAVAHLGRSANNTMLPRFFLVQIVCAVALAPDKPVELDAVRARISYIYFNIECAADQNTITEVLVTWVAPGSGAEKSGLKDGDHLIAIGGVPVSGRKRSEITNKSGGIMVRGKEVSFVGRRGILRKKWSLTATINADGYMDPKEKSRTRRQSQRPRLHLVGQIKLCPSVAVAHLGRWAKTVMSFIRALAICLSSFAFAVTPEAWIVEPPPTISRAKKVLIPTSDIFEVVASQLGLAMSELETKSFVAISEERAKKRTGHYYSCPKGKKPFLVRGVIGFAGTGHFIVQRIGEVVWICHESLGDEFVSSRSAIIVNLDFEPTAVYVSVLIAQ